MDVKEAVQTAKKYVAELFTDETIADVGLEEVEFNNMSNNWEVTIGFSRPWDHTNPVVAALGEHPSRRSYKLVRIDGDDGRVISITDRVLTASK